MIGRSWPGWWFPIRLCLNLHGHIERGNFVVLISEPLHQCLWEGEVQWRPGCLCLRASSDSNAQEHLSITGLYYSCLSYCSLLPAGPAMHILWELCKWEMLTGILQGAYPLSWSLFTTSALPHTASKTPGEIVWSGEYKRKKNMRYNCHRQC